MVIKKENSTDHSLFVSPNHHSNPFGLIFHLGLRLGIVFNREGGGVSSGVDRSFFVYVDSLVRLQLQHWNDLKFLA